MNPLFLLIFYRNCHTVLLAIHMSLFFPEELLKCYVLCMLNNLIKEFVCSTWVIMKITMFGRL